MTHNHRRIFKKYNIYNFIENPSLFQAFLGGKNTRGLHNKNILAFKTREGKFLFSKNQI
jgi:hypothetical protein